MIESTREAFFDARVLHATFRWSDFIFIDSEPFQLFFSLFVINSGLKNNNFRLIQIFY